MSSGDGGGKKNLWALPYRLQLKREREERLSLLVSGVRSPALDGAQACCTQSFFLLLFLSLCLTLGVALTIAGYKHFSAEVSAHHSFVPVQCLILTKSVYNVSDCFRGVCEEGLVARLLVEYVHRHQGRVQASAHETVTLPRHASEAEVLLVLDRFALNDTLPCFYNRKDAREVVMSVDYDDSFVVSIVLWVLLVLYVLGVSAGAFIYVVVKKAKARGGERDISGSDEGDENVCEEDPIFLIYDYGTFDPRRAASRKSPRNAPDSEPWT